jgi:methyl-accepting chemotaxis protein
MEVTLKKRIVTAIIIFTLAVTGSVILIQAYHQRYVLTNVHAMRAKLIMQILQDALHKPLSRQLAHDNMREELQAVLAALKGSGLIQSACVYSADGAILASTQNLLVGKQASSAELTFIKKTLTKSSHKNTLGRDIDKPTRTLRLYCPITASDGTVFIARLDTPLGNTKEALREAYVPSMLIALIVVAASILLWGTLSRRVINPISLLNTATKEIAAGDLNLKIHVDTKDELEELSDTFNLMAAKLKKTQQKR